MDGDTRDDRFLEVSQVTPGMVIVADVVNRNGTLVLPVGTILNEKHFRAFKIWGIERIAVKTAEEAQPNTPADDAVSPGSEDVPVEAPNDSGPAVDPVLGIAARKRIMHAFQLNQHNASDSPIKFLKEHAFSRMMARGESYPTEADSNLTDADESQEPTTRKPTVESIVERAETITSTPALYARLIAIVDHPLSSADDIGNVIMEDPGLTARLLRITNSSFYSFPRRVETVPQAITLVGTTQLCDLVLSTSVTKLFNQIPPELVDQRSFWMHSVACGVLARDLALLRRESNSERLFVAGLLHDIGRALLYVHAADHMRKALFAAQSRVQALHDEEREALGFTHALLGRSLLEAWNLPEALCQAVGRHHRPLGKSTFAMDAAIVHVADFMANAMWLGTSGARRIPPLEKEAWAMLNISEEVLPNLLDEAELKIIDMVALLSQEGLT